MSKTTDRDVIRKILVDALQGAWDDHCADTGCYPDFLELDGDRATAMFGIGNYVDHVAQLIGDKLQVPK